jgi:hypothetical protein
METMLSRRDTLALLLALGVPAGAEEPKAGEMTARVTLENDRVRVLEYASAGGSPVCGFGRHYHPAHITIFITPVRVRARRDDGTTMVADRKAGDVAWFEAAWHAVENVGPEAARICMVEIKDKDWKPSTGTSL